MVTNKKIYNYITTHLENGLKYVGTHSTTNKSDNYYGSGVLLRKAIKKYGKGLFIKTILCECNTLEEAYSNEEKYIKEYNTLHPNGYNVSPTGGKMKVGFRTRESINQSNKKRSGKDSVFYGVPKSEETKAKLNKALKGRIMSEKARAKMSEAKRNVSEETRKKYSDAAKKRKHTPESIEKMRLTKRGKKFTEEHKIKLKEARNKRPPCSEETKKKMSESHKGEKNPYYEKTGSLASFYGRKHSGETKEKMKYAWGKRPPFSEETKQKMRIAQAVRREREKEAALANLE